VNFTAPFVSLEGNFCDFRKEAATEGGNHASKTGLEKIKVLIEASGKSCFGLLHD
jgi:hypothetical protein